MEMKDTQLTLEWQIIKSVKIKQEGWDVVKVDNQGV